jgi:cation diffusion facilitator CzcD-associated flavoprotein CzcO
MTLTDTRRIDAPASTPATAAGGDTPHVRIAIIGIGFAGLGMAVRLKQAGINDFTVLERADAPGGTWRDNTYPGCACDVPSHLYSFSFAPNPEWSRTYSPQPEIRAYIQRTAERFGITAHVRWRHEVLDASWDDDVQVWTISTSQGQLTAQFLITGTGGLSNPSVPDIPGIERFEGAMFHTAAWDHTHDLTGERVAVIGTGASAIQVVPQIQPRVGHLDLYQRTPPWVMPHTDRPVRRFERFLFRRFPITQRAVRGAVYWMREVYVLGFTKNPAIMKGAARIARSNIERHVEDPELRAKLTPQFAFGCKRVLLSDTYYAALAEPNVDVVTSGIQEVTPTGIVTVDGVEHAADTIVLATGFKVVDNPANAIVNGRGGRNLAVDMQAGKGAYLGTTFHGFPNLFALTGPNTGLGHSSMVFMIESQIAYILDCLARVGREGAGTVEVREEAQAAFNDDVQRRMGHTVWSTGCASWYLDADGRNFTLWPGFTWQYRRRTRRFDPAPYEVRQPVAVPSSAPR